MPVKASAVGEFDALLRNEMLPEATPEACGAKVTVKDALSPAVSASGKVMPLTENPSPFQLPEDMVTAEPLAVSVPVRVVLLALSPYGTNLSRRHKYIVESTMDPVLS